MGCVVQNILGDASVYPPSSGTMIWIVIRRDGTKTPAEYHIQGVATTEKMAVAMCVDETYFIGPMPVNTAMPHATVEWIGQYFPKRRIEQETGSVELALAFFVCLIGSTILAAISFIGFIFQSAEATGNTATIWLVANVAFSVINAFVIWRSKHREEERVALEKLLGVRTMERDQAEKERDRASADAARVQSEYTTLAGIKLQEIIQLAAKMNADKDG